MPPVLGLAVLSGCARGDVARIGMPAPATEEGERIVALWQGSWLAAFGVGGVVLFLILWASVFHRRKRDRLPPQVRTNLPIEALVTMVPLIIVSVLFYFTARDEAVLVDTSRSPAVTVDVVAFQWSWKFYYEDDGINGRQLRDGAYVVGQHGERPQLVLPVGRRVEFNVYSQDVAHSFWVPAFILKRDALPYRQAPEGGRFWELPKEQQPYWNYRLQVVPTRLGTFAGRCSEYCGTHHAAMLFTVRVVTWSQYRDFIEQTRAAQATGAQGP